ncbi:hypothetical protein SAMN05446927_4598 [Caballeronia arationis]|uniref:NrS-1 polymerase-like helicase domain-containing protein n=1 Tax=Caballeronia arationis TaxID=1777142 RepID=A0A7Z7I9X8_9BURK|nr:DUF5906 domain-containing protein [Caballeronia arationis]SOE81320.1 hypothetical protein SAMN05446927_4598 [Caballeronia arationis]
MTQHASINRANPRGAMPPNFTAADASHDFPGPICSSETGGPEALADGSVTGERLHSVAGVVDRAADGKVDMSFDEAQVRVFVSLIGLPCMVLRIDATQPSAPHARTCATIDEVVASVREWNPKKWNIYWLPNVATVVDKKPTKQNIVTARHVWADCDPDIKQHSTYEAARQHLLTTHADKLAPIASFVIDSGNGLQAFFKLTEQLPLLLHGDYEKYEAVNKQIGEAFDGPSTYNCDRIMRLPGTLNWPTAAKLEKGYPKEPSLSRLLTLSDRAYSLEDLAKLLPPPKPATAPSKSETVSARTADVADQLQRFNALLASDHTLRTRWKGSTEGLHDTSGSAMDMSLYGLLVARGFSHDAIVEIMADWEHGGKGREQGERYWDRLKDNTKATLLAHTAMDTAVAKLNERFALVTVGGSVLVLDEESTPVNMLKVEAFRLLMANRTVDVPTANGNGIKKAPVAEAWLKHRDRRAYNRIEFAPGGGVPEDTYNLFRGWTVEPCFGMTLEQATNNCDLFLTHLQENLCRGNQELYKYLIRWYAHLFQQPGHKPGVAIAVSGEKGVGKSKVTEVIAELLGPHALTVSQRSHLTGQFNAHQAQALLIVAEEAVWAGDKQAEGALKQMITSPTMTLERKGVDAVPLKSCARFVMNSNAEWIFPASADERRLFALDCGSDHKQDDEYFKAIDDQLYGPGLTSHKPGQDSPGLRALLTYLLGLDLTDFNVRRVPETDALKAQRAASLDPHEQFLKDCLESHEICGTSWGKNAPPVPKRELHDAYLSYMRNHRRSYPVAQETFAKTIKRAFGWRTCQPRGKQRAWMVEGWNESRAAFEAAMKVKIED